MKLKKPPASAGGFYEYFKSDSLLFLGDHGDLARILVRAIATMNFNHVLGSELGWVVETNHFGFAADFNLLVLLALFNGQGLGVRIKADDFSLESLGGTSRENGTCQSERYDNRCNNFHNGY